MGSRIIITTRGRLDFQPTLNNLHVELRKLVTLICYPGEKIHHDKNWGHEVSEIIEHPKEFKHLGQIRKWCIENFDENVILLDDNLVFQVREFSELSNNCKFPLHQVTPKHFLPNSILRIQMEMFEWVIGKLNSNKYGVVGISSRQGNNRIGQTELENKRFFAFWAVNKKVYGEIKPYLFEKFPNKNDFCIGLEFLSKGVPNIISYKYAFNKQGGANNKGGCSIYRNISNSNKEAYDLYDLFPDFVRVREKSVKSWGGDFEDKLKALDVTCYWKKAYEWGIKNKI